MVATTVAPRLLITTAAVGSGHVSAANAVAQTAAARGIETRVVDALDHVPAVVRAGLPRAFVGLLRHAPGLVEQVGHRFAVRRETDDHGLHGLWLHPAMSCYDLPNAALADRVAALGIREDRLRWNGIPVDPRFTTLPTRAEARARLGIDPGGRPLILLIPAGLVPASAEAIVRGLASGFGPLEVAVATGRSVDLGEWLPRLANAHRPVRLHWLGISGVMPDWLAAADLVVGKPRGLTSSEALAAGRPFVVVDPYPLQEVANARYLFPLGAGVRAALVDDLVAEVWQLQPTAAPVAA